MVYNSQDSWISRIELVECDVIYLWNIQLDNTR